MNRAAAPAMTTTESSTAPRGAGRGRECRIADSSTSHLCKATPASSAATRRRPKTSGARSEPLMLFLANVSRATALAINARLVRIHARNVRSLAKVKRGSGS